MERFLKPLIEVCDTVRTEMGIEAGQDPAEEDKAVLLRKATEASVKAQVAKVEKTKVIQANWQGKKSAFPGEPKSKIKIHG